jgi:protein TonB
MTTNFGNELCFSKPRRDKATTAEAFGVSMIFHVAVVLAAAWLTIAPPRTAESEQQNILIPILEEDKVQQELPPPPPPPSSRELPQTVTDAPRGFQTLTVPTYISPDIPAPTLGPEIDEADFTGEGVEGGRGRGKFDPNAERVVTTEDISAAPAFTPYTVAPTLRNREEIARLLEKSYPIMLRDAGIEGKVMMWIFIDAAGAVRKAVVKETSGLEPLDSAAIRVTHKMRFSPAQNRDTKVPVWVSLPIMFEVLQ